MSPRARSSQVTRGPNSLGRWDQNRNLASAPVTYRFAARSLGSLMFMLYLNETNWTRKRAPARKISPRQGVRL
jgi:hypothetical protein